jgi:MoaA/NifB/PqqE/SkfB family radical SAM enzyme
MDFANILFGGPCNRFCPFCIGKQLPARVQVNNLNRYPLHNQDAFGEEVNQRGIRQVVFTGTVTDPSLYRHQERLLDWLRTHIHSGASYSLHSNGVLALQRMHEFNLYDKACLSFPSFNPQTYERMMGSPKVPDLAGILRQAKIPVKISCLITSDNYPEIDGFLKRCQGLGVERLVLRRLLGENRNWDILTDRTPHRHYRGNPVYDYDGMEVTYWNFDTTESTSINLFPDGTLGGSYLLTRTQQFSEPTRAGR